MALRDLLPFGKKRSDPTLSLDDWANYFSFNGTGYPISLQQTIPGEKADEIGSDFTGYIQGAYKANGVIFACMVARQLLFAEARFQFRQIQNGRPGNLFGTKALAPLETPWPGATTSDLLSRAIQDVDLAGNFYGARVNDRVYRLRPDWVTIVLGKTSRTQPVPEIAGYAYYPGGRNSGNEPYLYLPEEVAHFAPIPDPDAWYRGISWLTPVVREVMADQAATTHKLKFFENGATPNMVVTLSQPETPQQFEEWIEKFEARSEGLAKAYKTLYLAAGAQAEVVGANLRQLDFKVTQGAGETRIAAAAGVPPVIVGLSEGLQASTYSNYGQARRRFADGTIRPLWRNMAGSMARIIQVPGNAELWYDDRDIPFVQEDRKDAAEVQASHASAIKTLIDAGYEPQSVVDAVTSGDLTRLTHTGLVSVQLLPPGSSAAGSTNGNGNTVPEPTPSG